MVRSRVGQNRVAPNRVARKATVRNAVTLLEVLFAMGVVLVGLLGVASLVPVALHHAGRGHTADRSSIMGIRALHDFRAYAMDNPETWRQPNGSPVYRNPLAMATNKFYASSPPYLDYAPGCISGAYCIDPQYVAETRGAVAAPFDARVFPYFVYATPAEPRMNRISLVPTGRAPAASIALGSVLTRGHAKLLFEMDDELALEFPTDKTLPAVNRRRVDPGADGRWGVANTDDDGNGFQDDESEALWTGSDDVAGARLTESNYSWMATLVPKRDRIASFRDGFTLSIVVFQKRDPSMRAFEDLNGNGTLDPGEAIVGNEKLVNVTFDPSTIASGGIGLGGGEITLGAISAASPLDDLAVKVGDWILLAGSVVPANPDNAVFDFQWYRVTSVDDIDASSNTRNITISGPDWRIYPPGTVQATIMPGIVTVFTETIQLDLPNGGS